MRGRDAPPAMADFIWVSLRTLQLQTIIMRPLAERPDGDHGQQQAGHGTAPGRGDAERSLRGHVHELRLSPFRHSLPPLPVTDRRSLVVVSTYSGPGDGV